ncbi:redoxin domain-containing protein [Echinicola jeungdonensis]|uniref:Redoxin domain-containing protein n=1 Tax=Echinicola jeungdonensis TaxID=709343 RepID=A0ABV5J0U7_9BACT|nr:redoxin domain-containing protein [Echinicola jeungdonensis]MDN3668277.1 redoxin domain-containing protein [Echinicola jeungdonensis]
MKTFIFTFLLFLGLWSSSFAQKVSPFELNNLNSNGVFSLEDYNKAKAVVLIFTTNGCPFAKLYDERIIQLQQKFGPQGFQFAMINPHINMEEEESTKAIKAKIDNKNITFPYLVDDQQKISRQLGISKIPQAVVIQPSPTGFSIVYSGAIDNNPQLPEQASQKHLANALREISEGNSPSLSNTRPVGCNIEWKE